MWFFVVYFYISEIIREYIQEGCDRMGHKDDALMDLFQTILLQSTKLQQTWRKLL